MSHVRDAHLYRGREGIAKRPFAVESLFVYDASQNGVGGLWHTNERGEIGRPVKTCNEQAADVPRREYDRLYS